MVHAVLVGITPLPMLVTVPTKLNLVNLVRSSPLRRAFSFCNTLVKHSGFNLGGITRHGGGNRYQSSLLILTSGLPSHDHVLLF